MQRGSGVLGPQSQRGRPCLGSSARRLILGSCRALACQQDHLRFEVSTNWKGGEVEMELEELQLSWLECSMLRYHVISMRGTMSHDHHAGVWQKLYPELTRYPSTEYQVVPYNVIFCTYRRSHFGAFGVAGGVTRTTTATTTRCDGGRERERTSQPYGESYPFSLYCEVCLPLGPEGVLFSFAHQ